MLRRSGNHLFRATRTNRGGGGLPHVMTAEEAPCATETMGFFCKLNGPLAMLRPLDIKWILNRFVDLGRDGYIASPVLYLMMWGAVWKGQSVLLWGDAAPPRNVDWNNGTAGSLPKDFVKTEL